MKKNIISKMISFIMASAMTITLTSIDTTVKSSAEDYSFEYKNALTSESQMIYDGLDALSEISSETVNITLPEAIEITANDEQTVQTRIAEIINPGFQFFLLDRPDVFWIENSPSFSYNYTTENNNGETTYVINDISFNFATGDSYNNDLQSVRDCKEELDNALNNFSVSGETRYEKVKSIHDQLIETTSYDAAKDPMNYNAYGALVNHVAACQGYSSAFKLLCDRENIPCVLVLLDYEHMWNYVQMEDGQWYAVDNAWDDYNFVEHITGTGVSYDYFLKGMESMFRKNHIAPSSNYGVKNNLPALPMNDYVPETAPETKRTPQEVADVDGDGVISASDAVICTVTILSYDSEHECDINNDGYTNSFDLIALKRLMKKAKTA